jgi:hypothetical protein
MQERRRKQVLYVCLLLLSLLPLLMTDKVELGVGGTVLCLAIVLAYIHSDRMREDEKRGRPAGFPVITKVDNNPGGHS